MPRLVLLEDDGRELFAGPVSRANVARVAAFLREHMGTLQALARARRAVSSVVDSVEQVTGLLASAAPPPRRRRR